MTCNLQDYRVLQGFARIDSSPDKHNTYYMILHEYIKTTLNYC